MQSPLYILVSVSRPGIEDPLPKDAVKYDGLIQKMPHPTEGQMEIFIVQVDDPGMFYLHWFKKREALDDLMSKMRYEIRLSFTKNNSKQERF